MKLSLLTGLLAFFGLAAEADFSQAPYICPMHPKVARDVPCECRDCGKIDAGVGRAGLGRDLGAFRYHAALG